MNWHRTRILKSSALLVVGIYCAAAQGCTSPVVTAGSEESATLDHEVEHGIPEHKPRTFTRAVAELLTRVQQIEHAEADASVPQLRDIVGWLPELAADTDLNEADWNIVQQTAQELQTLVQRWPVERAQPSAADLRVFRDLVQRLQPLAEAARDDNGPAAEDEPVVLQQAGK